MEDQYASRKSCTVEKIRAKSNHGVFLPLETIDEKSLVKAYRDLLKQKPQDQAEGEGVMKELQAL